MAEKKRHKRKLEQLRQSIMFRLRAEFENIDVKVMSFVFTIVVMISVIAATIAWFTLNVTAKMDGLTLTSAGVADIEISLEENPWKNIGTPCNETTDVELLPGISDGSETEDENGDRIQAVMPAFYNIYDLTGEPVTAENSGILAPGTYGSFTFWVKPVGGNTGSCEITISKVLEFEDRIQEIEEKKTEAEKLAEGHILCFSNRSKNDGVYVYSGYLSREDSLTVSFQKSADGEYVPAKITVYWIWPYEYEDLAEFEEDGKRIFDLPQDLSGILVLSPTSGGGEEQWRKTCHESGV